MLPSTTELTILSIGSVSLLSITFILIFVVTMLRLLRIQQIQEKFIYVPVEERTQSKSSIPSDQIQDIIAQQQLIQQARQRTETASTQEARSVSISIKSDAKQMSESVYRPRPIST